MGIELTERPVPDGVLLKLVGDLTYANREDFKRAVDLLHQKACRHLILDLAGVSFVDSSGLGMLALVSQHFTQAQGHVSLLRPQRYVREIMSLANITQLMPIHDDEQDALAWHSRTA